MTWVMDSLTRFFDKHARDVKRLLRQADKRRQQKYRRLLAELGQDERCPTNADPMDDLVVRDGTKVAPGEDH